MVQQQWLQLESWEWSFYCVITCFLVGGGNKPLGKGNKHLVESGRGGLFADDVGK